MTVRCNYSLINWQIVSMQELFDDILEIEGLKGLMLCSFSGDLIFKDFNHAVQENAENMDWHRLIESLDGMRETDLIFKKGRVYIRRTEAGYLILLMGIFAPIAMVRLQCDILLPSLKPAKAAKGIKRLFRK